MARREPRPKVLDAERFRAWRTAGGTGLEATLSVFTLLGTFTKDGETKVPPPSPQFMQNLLGLAWREDTAAALREILDQAGRDPGPDGFQRAIVAMQRVWDNVFIAAPPKTRGAKRKQSEVNDFKICVDVAPTLADARHLTEDAALRAFVQKREKRRLNEADLRKKVRHIRNALQRARRTYGKARLEDLVNALILPQRLGTKV